ncbi:MAG: tetratricopeptide repeat protein [Chloroflexota bacterium]|nr:tetratricopeptide repeat protein [Chloroflexota bacterium]
MPHPQRAADERCERRTGEPSRAAEQAPALRIELLGGFRVMVGERVVAAGTWRLAKARGLVKLLALAPGHRLTREQVLDLLWPDLDPVAAGNNFHRTLHAARRALDAEPVASLLRLQQGVLALQPPGLLWVDVAAFEAAAAAARGRQDPAAYQAAVDLYTGDLLPEDRYEDWATGQREALRATYLALLVELARLLEACGHYVPAIAALQRAAAEERTHEEAHVGLMRLYALAGQRQQALRQYQLLRAALRQELDAEPDPASQRLYAEILGGRYPAVTPPSQPAPVSPGARRHNLPAPLTRFVGRERELARVKELLFGGPQLQEAHPPPGPCPRLVTLTGAGGSGKTRLALAVAVDIVTCYPDGVWLVELAALQDPALVPGAVTRALGVREQPGRAPLDTLVDALRDKSLLLVLDNCEHLVDACAHLATTLLGASPRLQLLATSRTALRVPGEVTWTVPPLRLPDPRQPLTAEALAGSEAVALFVDRSRWRLPAFAVTQQNASAVVEICRRLDGLPLAIELAAARVPVLAPEQLATRLDDALRVLTGGSRTAPSRQQTLRATLDWSYALLDERERTVFRRLAVFAGGWALAAAEAVCGDERVPGDDVLTILAHLVDKSLVLAEAGAEAARYRLLETVRQYAWEWLLESGETERIRQGHAEYYLALAETAETELTGPEQAAWLDRLEREHGNLRAALRWSLEAGEAETGLRLAGALWQFWASHGHLGEGRRWLDAALTAVPGLANPQSGGASTAVRAKALAGAGDLARNQSDSAAARAFLLESLALSRRSGDQQGVGKSLTNLGVLAAQQGDYPTARQLLDESLTLYRELGDQHGVASALNTLGVIAKQQGQYERAVRLYTESLALFRKLGNKQYLAKVLANLGVVGQLQGEYRLARELLEESLTFSRELGDKISIGNALHNLGVIAKRQGDYERAVRLYTESLELARQLGEKNISKTLVTLGSLALRHGDHRRARALYAEALALCRELGDREVIAYCLEGLADVARVRGEADQAARLWGAAERLRETIGAPLSPVGRADYEHDVTAARAQLGQAAFAAAWAEGRAMPLEQVIAEVLATTDPFLTETQLAAAP